MLGVKSRGQENRPLVPFIGEHRAQKQEVFAVIDLEKNTLVLYEKLKTDYAKTFWTGSDLIDEGIITSLTSFYDFPQEDQAVFRDKGRFTAVR